VTTINRPLRLNIGFLLGQSIGTSREFNFDYPSIRLGDDLCLLDFSGSAIFSRTPQGLFLQAHFQGTVKLECVRCLEEANHEIRMDFSDLYAFDYRSISESGLLVPESGYIDLEPLLREYALLEIPISPICKITCQGLCWDCGQNLNESDCGHHQGNPESTLPELKTINHDQTGSSHLEAGI
jgi:uncharacterized protein